MQSYNNVSMMGKLYNYKLEERQGDNGSYIFGTVTLEVDDKGTRVDAQFFATPTYKSGKPNRTYTVLEEMLSGNYNTVVDNGDECDWFDFSGASIDSSYFASQREQGEVASAQRIRGAFINANRSHKFGNKWKLDFVITQIQDVEADEEKHYPRYVKVSGYSVNDYAGRVDEVRFQARDEAAMNYISGLTATPNEPYFVSTWGEIRNVISTSVTKNAFGEDEVREYTNTQWVITGMAPDCYEMFEEYPAFKAELEKTKAAALEASSTAEGGKDDLPF